MIFDLIKDFADVLDALPQEHPQHHILKLLDEAIRRDVQFIDRHPTTFFQCMWNTCWWYDCPEAAKHYEEPEGGWKVPPPWERGQEKISDCLQEWRSAKEWITPGFIWVRMVRPPSTHLESAQIAVLRDHEKGISSVAISPDGSRVFSGDHNETVKIWDAVTGKAIASFQDDQYQLKKQTVEVTELAVSPNNESIAVGFGTMTDCKHLVRVLSSNDAFELALLTEQPEFDEREMIGKRPSSKVTCLAFSQDGQQIATGAKDGFLRTWNTSSGENISSCRGHWGGIVALAYSFDERRIVTCGENPAIVIWSWDLKIVYETERFGGPILSVSFQGDWPLVAGRSAKGLFLRRVIPDQETKHIELEEMNISMQEMRFARFSSDESLVACCGNTKIGIWRTTDGKLIRILDEPEEGVSCLAFDCFDKTLVSGGGRSIRLWSLNNNHVERNLAGHSSRILKSQVSPDQAVIASYSKDGEIRLWDLRSGLSRRRLIGHRERVTEVAFSPNSKIIASWARDATVRAWNVASGEQQYCLRESVGRVEFSPDSSKLLCCGDNSGKIWEAASGKLVSQLEKPSARRRIFSLNSNILAGVCSINGNRCDTIRIWDVASGRNVSEINYDYKEVATFAVSPDGSIIASCLVDYSFKSPHRVYLWDSSSGRMRMVLKSDRKGAECICFSNRGDLIATSTSDNYVLIWNVQDAELIHVILSDHRTSDLVFSHDDKRLAGRNEDYQGQIWDVLTGESLRSLNHCSDLNRALRGQEAYGFSVAVQAKLAWLPGESTSDRKLYGRVWKYHDSVHLGIVSLEGDLKNIGTP